MLVEEIERKGSAIEEMAKLITEGRVGEFVKLFPTLRLKRVATSMFIHVTKSGILKDQIPQIMFRDEEYLVVASHIGFEPDGSPLVAIWVLGEEDDMLWIHRLMQTQTNRWILDGNGSTRDIIVYTRPDEPRKPMLIGIPTDLTKEGIKRMMGFDYEYKNKPVFELNKIVRIQGDLVGVRIREFTDELIKEETRRQIEYEQHYTRREYDGRVERAVRERILKENPELRMEIEDQSRYARIFNLNGNARNTEELAIFHKDFPPKNFYKTQGRDELEWKVKWEMEEKRAKESPEFLEEYQKELTEDEGKALSKIAYKLSDENSKQETLRFENHVIIIEKALQENLFTSRDVEIPKKTTAFLIHDEHGVTKIELDRGIYEFRLLPRHQLG